MTSTTPLSTIIALARAGALDHAWGRFAAAGYDRADDPAALTVKGRLLKDHALRAEGEARRHYYLQSAEAYRRSAALQPATYPLINAATLSLLSGDRGQAEEIAREVLDRIAREPEEPETPYWRAATEAEALLLLGRSEDSRAALEAALAAAPCAWEDHASTLRQFLLILEQLGGDACWLDRLRPPRSLHYAAAAGVEDGEALSGLIAARLEAENVGFGFGGLAAGAEIVVAETLLARGAELHLVLPSDPSRYAAARVDPFGAAWRRRFEAAIEAAETVEHVRPLDTVPDRGLLELAGDVALGASLLNADRLMSEAVAMRIGLGSRDSGRVRTHALAAEGAAAEARDLGGAGEAAPDAPLALLAISVASGGDAAFEQRLEELREVLVGSGPSVVAPHLNGDIVLLGLAAPAEAAAIARRVHRALRGRMPLRLAAHFGRVGRIRDPFSGLVRPSGSGAEIAVAIIDAAPTDTICVSHDFAAVLAAGGGAPADTNWIGELQAFDGGSPIGLYSLRPGDRS